MKQYIITVIIVLQASVLFAQQEKRYIRKGNELYQQQNYKDAESNYRVSVGKQGKTLEGNFNLGDAMYKLKKYDEAGKQFAKIAASKSSKDVLAKAYHNLGNSLLQSNKLEESVTAYKKSLLNNPQDDETRYNLAYALEKLKKKQQQDKNNKNNKNNKDKNKDNKDNKDKDKKDQDKKNDDKNKDNKDNKDNKNGQDKNDPNKNNEGQKPDPNNVSKEDAERMLEALNNDEKQTQDKLKNKKQKGAKVRIEKEW